MLEFAREQWLWLFLLVGVFYVAWWFARRYRKQRVTYGLIWQRVARRVLPPGWKRVLRTVLTLLVSGLMLSAIVLKAAGLQRPESEQPAPLLVFIVLDNSPGMRAIEGDLTRTQLAQQQAQAIVDRLSELDRAALVWRQDGRMLVGPWLKPGDVVGDTPHTNWSESTRAADLGRVPWPPDLPSVPPPERVCIELTDSDHAVDLGVTTLRQTIGSSRSNDGVATATYEPPANDGSNGGLLVTTHFGGAVIARELNTGQALKILPESGVFRVLLPIQPEPLRVRVSIATPDALRQDDSFTAYLDPPRLATVTLCYPAEDGEPNVVLRDALAQLLPGREVVPHAVPGDGAVTADLVICDRAVPAEYTARYLLCFGDLPRAFGQTDAPAAAEPNMQLRLEPPAGLGFEVPDLTLLSAREAVPLQPGHALTPLAGLMDGRTLVGVQRGSPEVLYVGFVPHKSTLLTDGGMAGPLLLLRWLNAIQGGARERLPLFVQPGQEAEFELERSGTLEIKLADDTPWLPSYGPRSYTVASGPGGRGKLGPFVIPGEYTVSRDGREIGRLTAFAEYDADLAVAVSPVLELDALFDRGVERDWRDSLPAALLWIALGLMVLEWLLWLVGITE